MKMLIFAVMTAIIAVLAGATIYDLEKKRQIRWEKNVEIQAIIAGMNKVPDGVKPHMLCQLEWRASRWGAVQQAVEAAERAGVKIELYKVGFEAHLKMWRDMSRFAFEAIKAFEENSGVSCIENQTDPQPPRLEFGRNAYTLMVALGTFREAELGEPAILREHAISLLRDWIAIRKAGGDPKADRTVEDVGKAFSISNFDLGLNTPEESRKYFQQLE